MTRTLKRVERQGRKTIPSLPLLAANGRRRRTHTAEEGGLAISSPRKNFPATAALLVLLKFSLPHQPALRIQSYHPLA